MPLVVERADAPPPDWGAYAAGQGMFYHLPGWVTALGEAFALPATWLSARRAGVVEGILPLLRVPAFPGLGPRRLVSLPFSYAAGIAAATGEARIALASAAREHAARTGARRVELKGFEAAGHAPEGWERVTRYDTYRVALAGGGDAVWARLHADSTRRGIRRAERLGITVRRGESAADWRRMAELVEATSHGHGVPAPPRRFFTDTARALQERGLADLRLAIAPGGPPVAGIVLWTGPREWIYAFGAAERSRLDLRPNHALLWQAIRDAVAAGVPVFDLGRAAREQSGLVQFKLRWGGEPVPLAHDYWPGAGGLHAARRDAGGLALAGRIWSRLPRSAARAGSHLYRYLG